MRAFRETIWAHLTAICTLQSVIFPNRFQSIPLRKTKFHCSLPTTRFIRHLATFVVVKCFVSGNVYAYQIIDQSIKLSLCFSTSRISFAIFLFNSDLYKGHNDFPSHLIFHLPLFWSSHLNVESIGFPLSASHLFPLLKV